MSERVEFKIWKKLFDNHLQVKRISELEGLDNENLIG